MSLRDLCIRRVSELPLARPVKSLPKELRSELETRYQARRDSLNYVIHDPCVEFPRIIYGSCSFYHSHVNNLDWIPVAFNKAELFIAEEDKLIYKLRTEFRTKDPLVRMRVIVSNKKMRRKEATVVRKEGDQIQIASLIYRHGSVCVVAGYAMPGHTLIVDFTTDMLDLHQLEALICYPIKKVNYNLWYSHTVD